MICYHVGMILSTTDITPEENQTLLSLNIACLKAAAKLAGCQARATYGAQTLMDKAQAELPILQADKDDTDIAYNAVIRSIISSKILPIDIPSGATISHSGNTLIVSVL